ncbi:MAG: methyltransferase domain-containing protein [Gemmatimonadetes bacterium]|nr:methyltransferase domain-containing protein [Gemmatimonadota bacterium]
MSGPLDAERSEIIDTRARQRPDATPVREVGSHRSADSPLETLIRGLDERTIEPELMDDPAIDDASMGTALDGLGRVHAMTGSIRLLWPIIERWAYSNRYRGIFRVLDVASGGGQLTIAIARRLGHAGVSAKVHGCDLSSTAVEYANDRAMRAGVDAEFFQMDAVEDLPDGYDVITSSLFLHHLERDEAVRFLSRVKARCRHFLVHDLLRSRWGFALAYVGVRALRCGRVCYSDAPGSVSSAFTIEEVRALVKDAELEGAAIEARFPARFLLYGTIR